MREAMSLMLEEKLAPGAVAAVWNLFEPTAIWGGAWGSRRSEPTPEPMAPSTVFDLASLTKPLVTTTLIARMVDRGLIEWQTPICSVLPGAPHEWKSIEVWHLLSHTAGFKAWEPFWMKLQARWGAELSEVSIHQRQQVMREEVFGQMPETTPGSRTLYSDVSFLLLGFLIEELSGMPLDHAWKELGFAAGFRRVHRSASVRQPVDDAVAATERSEWRGGVLQGEVHDENCWSMGGYAGHAGLFGSASDVLTIVNAIFNERLISEGILDAVFARVTPASGHPRTLGWDIPSGEQSSAGKTLASRRGVVGHLGFTGTSLWVDRVSGWAGLLLTNRVHLGRDHLGIRRLRPLFYEAMAADFGIDRLSGFGRP